MAESIMGGLVDALLDGDQARAVALAGRLRQEGVEDGRIVTEGVEAAMAQLDAKCTAEQFNLLEIMLSGRAVMEVMNILYPPDAPPPRTKATVVVGSLEGDVHDLGKNILKMVLSASGYRVVDCGRDCPLDTLVDAAGREEALAVGVSGLITSVIPQVRLVKEKLAGQGLGRVRVLAGGAALKMGSPERLNVDFVAQTAFDGLRYLEPLIGASP